MRPAVFLDRDGTINEQMGYINHLSRFHLLPGVAAAIRLLNQAGVPVVVVSNQSGVGRGYFPASLVNEVHDMMKNELAREEARVDGLYFCPHHPEAKVEEYRLACHCRKPKIGMFEAAAREMGLDLSASYVVGDRWTDLKAAANCGATGVLVLTGYGRGDLLYMAPVEAVKPRHVAEDLHAAVQWILQDMAARTR
ncbi:MAG: D-glycero-beta-D-manno-heptose-1,7-bisphosphate 7-phosphatase [Deltaproteobacteria bacterium CG23_combo_of_CG06-09_8_20_14_all_60_8]|nr:MAG: D,D-heptose 1,7-bisphosphate phosphatase [Desulfobacterales bacterium CG2_30_60_27]PIP44502.1 MAG: D-glycero-beta-D-manno-heptose-1,7-bisphosphate 7-phosphatase [Deltaproteobacteria bacterium CG23_combo_of_CG06-09_8_20_14_all_60_8]